VSMAFDYIIVGAGSAGCVLASRLTEDPQIRVLLVEAGPKDRSWRIDMPSAVGSLLSSDRFNWNYVSDPEPHLDGRRLTHPRGRVLGGSSSINGMVYIRGHAGDYDGWAASGLTMPTANARRVSARWTAPRGPAAAAAPPAPTLRPHWGARISRS
jgi:choline dehydrogenase